MILKNANIIGMTAMNYETASDFEINKAVAEALGLKSDSIRNLNESNIAVYPKDRPLHWENADYCNKPSDAWPIIVENGISLDAPILDQGWLARTDWHCRSIHDNGLRAAMIVFLKMKDATK